MTRDQGNAIEGAQSTFSQYPETLIPTSFDPIETRWGVVSVPKATPVFSLSDRASGINTFGGKSLLDFDGSACFAELVILKHFTRAGWSGRWIVESKWKSKDRLRANQQKWLECALGACRTETDQMSEIGHEY